MGRQKATDVLDIADRHRERAFLGGDGAHPRIAVVIRQTNNPRGDDRSFPGRGNDGEISAKRPEGREPEESKVRAGQHSNQQITQQRRIDCHAHT